MQKIDETLNRNLGDFDNYLKMNFKGKIIFK